MSDDDRSPLPDTGVAATGYVCQNFPEHPGEEPKMVSSGPGEVGVICPECGRMAGGPDDEIPYGDPPEYATDGGAVEGDKYHCNHCGGDLRKMEVGKVCLDCGDVHIPSAVTVHRYLHTGEER